MFFGSRLKDAMLAAGFTDPARFAKKMGISRTTVEKWLESPVVCMSGKNLVIAAALLSVRAHWLATGEGVMQRFHAAVYTEEEMLSAFRLLTPRERVMLRDMAGIVLKFSRED